MSEPPRRPLVVAIDGPAGVGKSTIARRLAEALGWAYLDSGALYRVLTLAARESGLAVDDVDGIVALGRKLDAEIVPDGSIRLGPVDVTRRIRDPDLTRWVPLVAAQPAVRALVVEWQRHLARRAGRVAAEGRDTGSVVFPDADAKIYLDADVGERAARRFRQETGRDPDGEPAAVARVRAGIEERDGRDRARSVAPLEQAPDAWRLDTTGLTLDEVFEAVLSHVRSRIPTTSGDESGA